MGCAQLELDTPRNLHPQTKDHPKASMALASGPRFVGLAQSSVGRWDDGLVEGAFLDRNAP